MKRRLNFQVERDLDKRFSRIDFVMLPGGGVWSEDIDSRMFLFKLGGEGFLEFSTESEFLAGDQSIPVSSGASREFTPVDFDAWIKRRFARDDFERWLVSIAKGFHLPIEPAQIEDRVSQVFGDVTLS